MGIGVSLRSLIQLCVLFFAFLIFANNARANNNSSENELETTAFFPSASHAFFHRINVINSAQKQLNLSYFLYTSDTAGLATLAALRDAARRGVKVQIALDAFYNRISPEILNHLAEEGVEIRVFHPLVLSSPIKWLFKRLHLKVLTADDNMAIIGSRNIDDSYFCISKIKKTVDEEVLLNSISIVRSLTSYFELLWNSKHLQKFPHKSKAHAVAKAKDLLDQAKIKLQDRQNILKRILTDSELHFKSVSKIKLIAEEQDIHQEKIPGIPQKIIELFESAQKEIVILSPYVVLSGELKKLILNTQKRGIQVRLITNSRESNDQKLSQEMYELDKYDLLKEGIEIWELRKGANLHTKSFIIDDTRTYLGSYNLNARSQYLDVELGIVIEGEEFTTTFKNHVFDRYRKISKRIGLKDQLPRPIITRCKDFLIRTTSRLLRNHI